MVYQRCRPSRTTRAPSAWAARKIWSRRLSRRATCSSPRSIVVALGSSRMAHRWRPSRSTRAPSALAARKVAASRSSPRALCRSSRSISTEHRSVSQSSPLGLEVAIAMCRLLQSRETVVWDQIGNYDSIDRGGGQVLRSSQSSTAAPQRPSERGPAALIPREPIGSRARRVEARSRRWPDVAARLGPRRQCAPRSRSHARPPPHESGSQTTRGSRRTLRAIVLAVPCRVHREATLSRCAARSG